MRKLKYKVEYGEIFDVWEFHFSLLLFVGFLIRMNNQIADFIGLP